MLNVPSSQTGSVDTHPPEPVDSPETSEAAVDTDGNDTPPPKRGRSSWWSSLSVGLKLGLSFGLLGLAVGLLGAATWMAGQNITSQGQILVGEQLPIERSVREWRTQSIQLGEMSLRTTSSSDVFPLTMAISRLVEQEKALVEDITSRVQLSAGRLEMASTLESALSSRASYAVKRDQLVEDALEGKLVSQRQKSEHEEALQAYLRAIDAMLGVSERAAQQAWAVGKCLGRCPGDFSGSLSGLASEAVDTGAAERGVPCGFSGGRRRPDDTCGGGPQR